jgi:hypothetical protein
MHPTSRHPHMTTGLRAGSPSLTPAPSKRSKTTADHRDRIHEEKNMRTTRTTLSALTLLALAALLLAPPAAAQLTINETTNATCEGCVGVGTATPEATFHIFTSTGAVATLLKLSNDHAARLAFENTATGVTWFARVGNATSAFGISDDGDSVDEFNLDRDGNLTIAGGLASAGPVGIGTTSPVAQLDVIGDEVDVLRLSNNGNVKLIMEDIGGTADDHKWVINNANSLRFAADDPVIAQMTLDDSGNMVIQGSLSASGPVGIGTQSPDANLDIEASGPTLRLTNTGTFGGHWSQLIDPDSGRLNWENSTGVRPIKLDQTADNNLLRVGIPSSDTVEVNGVLSVNGSVSVGGPIGIGTATPLGVVHVENAPIGDADDFVVTDTGDVGIGKTSPTYALEIFRDAASGENAVITAERDGGARAFLNASSSLGAFGTANSYPVAIWVNSVQRMQLNTDNSLTMASGATCSPGGVWISTSTRAAKDNIRDLSSDEAIETLAGLEPVRFNYKAEPDEESLGFIAEDVPDLVATNSRDSLSPMDLVAVLTKVVQEQQKTIADLSDRVAQLEASTPR